MNEQMYTPEEVAIKVLDKVKTLYQGSALYKSNTAHEVEDGGEPVSEDAECPESLSAENSEAVKDEDKKEKKKKGADSVSETSETSENSVAAENEMAENIEFEEQPDEDVDSFEPDHEKDMAPDEEKEHDAAENEADEADADTIEADEEIGDAEENSRKDIKAVTKDKKKKDKDKDVEKSENLAKGCGATPMKKWAGKATERTMPFNPSKDKVKERTMPFNPLKDKVKERTMPYKPSKVEAQNIDIKKPKSSKLGSFLKLRKKRHLDKNMMPKDEKQEKVGIKRQQKPQDLPKGPSNIGY